MPVLTYTLASLLLSLFVSTAEGAVETLNFSVTIERPTCDLDVVGGSGGTIDLGEIDITKFEKEQTPIQAGQGFALQLSNCKGAGWVTKPSLTISGAQEDVTGNGVFRQSAKSTSQNIGILLKYGATDFSQAQELTGTPFTWVLSQDMASVPADAQYNFWVGPTRVSDYAQTRAGTVSADIHFSFEWR
ncbi:TPA: type 1 fimbrial protein [Escherichia coli]|nr:type 1 fimbrial protein [Escherichia coli]